jgi:hypothetical protein
MSKYPFSFSETDHHCCELRAYFHFPLGTYPVTTNWFMVNLRICSFLQVPPSPPCPADSEQEVAAHRTVWKCCAKPSYLTIFSSFCFGIKLVSSIERYWNLLVSIILTIFRFWVSNLARNLGISWTTNWNQICVTTWAGGGRAMWHIVFAPFLCLDFKLLKNIKCILLELDERSFLKVRKQILEQYSTPYTIKAPRSIKKVTYLRLDSRMYW